MHVTSKSVIRDEIWRAQEKGLSLDLALLVHVGDKVVLPHETMKAILEKAGFEMVEMNTRFPRASA